jgi:antitoxin component YwqK of YwqJK toxin-antitoxin module
MIGWLLGIANKKPVLVKIDFFKSNINRTNIVDKNNASYLSSNYKIVEIVDEFLNKYISVDLEILLNEKISETENLKLGETYEKKLVFFYLNKRRALENIYLFNSKSTGIYKQYLLDGNLNGQISLKNGYLNGMSKVYDNGNLIEETEYKNGQKHGLSVKYDKTNNVVETTKWLYGLMLITT